MKNYREGSHERLQSLIGCRRGSADEIKGLVKEILDILLKAKEGLDGNRGFRIKRAGIFLIFEERTPGRFEAR